MLGVSGAFRSDWILWRLDLASELFQDFFAYYFGGKKLPPARGRAESDPLLQGKKMKVFDEISVQNSRRNTVVVGQKFGIPQVEFGHGKRAL